MDDTCHRTLKKGHTGELKQRFSKVQVPKQPHHIVITIHPQTVAAVGVGAVGLAGLSVAAVLASEFVLLALPLVMGPGAVMTTHRLLLAHHHHYHHIS